MLSSTRCIDSSRQQRCLPERAACTTRQPCPPSSSHSSPDATLQRRQQQARRWMSTCTHRPRHARQRLCAAEAQAPMEEQLTATAVLLEQVTSCKDFEQLSKLASKYPDALLHGPLNVYVLLQAASMRELLELDPQDMSPEQAAKHLQTIDQAGDLIATLADALVASVPRFPLVTQGAVALALTQLQYYSADTLDAIAAAVMTALQQPETDEETGSSQPGQTSQTNGVDQDLTEAPPAALLSKSFSGLQRDALPGVVLTLVAGFSLSGHYSEQLFNGLMAQVLANQVAFTDVDNTVAICSALLDIQHYSPQVLQAATTAAWAQLPTISAPTLVSLLLALAFFRVGSSSRGFVDAALQELAGRQDLLGALGPKHAAQLWRACVLLHTHSGVQPPAGVLQVLRAARQQQGELLVLGPCPGAVDPATVQELQQASQELYAEWETAGLLTPADMVQELQQLGYEVHRAAPAGVAAFPSPSSDSSSGRGAASGGEGGSELQQQQEQQLDEQWPPVLVDITLDGAPRRVAVMVLTSERYCCQPPSRLRGTSALDISVLQALGWVVLPLPVREWQQLGSQAAKREYLSVRLRAALG